MAMENKSTKLDSCNCVHFARCNGFYLWPLRKARLSGANTDSFLSPLCARDARVLRPKELHLKGNRNLVTPVTFESDRGRSGRRSAQSAENRSGRRGRNSVSI